MIKGQMAAQDERSSESCLPCEINVRRQENVDLAASAANLEEAWYYVVDCTTCKAVIPFKHSPENEAIMRFPTMRVRCFHCDTNHAYAADLISHRKAVSPCGILKRDPPPSQAHDSDREAPRDQQEDRSAGDSEKCVILEREIVPISASLPYDNLLIPTVSGNRATIFFLSSCFFAAGWVSHLARDIFYPVPLAVLNGFRSPGLAMLLGTAFLGTVLIGLLLFVIGMGSFFVEAFGFDHRLIKRAFARIDSISRLARGAR